MNVYIANFGSGNWAWPECVQRSAIAVMDDVRTQPYWKNGDLEGYVKETVRLLKHRDGTPRDRGTATRWYKEISILHESSGDLWLHNDQTRLWWTISKPDPVTYDVRPEPDRSFGSERIFVYFKPCLPWSSKDKQGRELFWNALHARAKMFLMNQGTFQPVLNDNALYVQALVQGADLAHWHSLSEWDARAEKSGKGAVRSYSPAEIAKIEEEQRMQQTAARMIKTAQQTAIQSGQELLSITKDKQFRFPSDAAAQQYALDLMKGQEGRCALTGLKMLLDEEPGDDQLRYSLDRIDSSRHYEPGNLQVVCKFVNKWKGAMANDEFKRLIEVVRHFDSR